MASILCRRIHPRDDRPAGVWWDPELEMYLDTPAQTLGGLLGDLLARCRTPEQREMILDGSITVCSHDEGSEDENYDPDAPRGGPSVEGGKPVGVGGRPGDWSDEHHRLRVLQSLGARLDPTGANDFPKPER